MADEPYPGMKRSRLSVDAWMVAVVGVIVVGLILAFIFTRPGGGNAADDLKWTGIESSIVGHIDDFNRNVAAGNTQGALNVRTKIVADCQDARRTGHGNTADETAVRKHCADAGFPLP